jgi:hypothetical protein
MFHQSLKMFYQSLVEPRKNIVIVYQSNNFILYH